MPSIAASGSPALEARLRRALAMFPEIAAAWLFGSRARGDARADSDVDVAILLRASIDPHDPGLLGAIAVRSRTRPAGS